MYPTQHHRPDTVTEAVADLSAAEDAKVLAGGQTLIPTMKQHLAAPKMLIDVRNVAGLSDIRLDGDMLEIGATATHATVATDATVAAKIPALAYLAGHIGDPAVRHMGTIGGSLANNDPSACYPSSVLALGATVKTDRRSLSADEFFEGLFATALEEDELIVAVRFPVPGRAAYAKFPNPASRYAMTGVFVAETGGAVRVAVTGAGDDGVFRHEGLEAALSATFSAESVDAVEVSPDGLMSDMHGSAAYRANLIKVMTKRAVASIA